MKTYLEWHDASKELPKERNTYLCLYNDYDGAHTQVSLLEHRQYLDNDWWIGLDDWYDEWREIDVNNIKYWASLPTRDDIEEAEKLEEKRKLWSETMSKKFKIPEYFLDTEPSITQDLSLLREYEPQEDKE